MSKRTERINEEAAALWRALHDVDPPEGCQGAELLDFAMRSAPVAEYERLQISYLRDRNLVWPKSRPH